jgi:hypothetical protein
MTSFALLAARMARCDDSLSMLTLRGRSLPRAIFRWLSTRLLGWRALRIVIRRDGRRFAIAPVAFDDFDFRSGDEIELVPARKAAALASTPDGCRHVRLDDTRAIRVPPRMTLTAYNGFQLPEHLVLLTGAGSETLGPIGKAHVSNYAKFMGIRSDMAFLEIGCGIGRDAFELLDVIDPKGRYIGVDVTRDSFRRGSRALQPAGYQDDRRFRTARGGSLHRSHRSRVGFHASLRR